MKPQFTLRELLFAVIATASLMCWWCQSPENNSFFNARAEQNELEIGAFKFHVNSRGQTWFEYDKATDEAQTARRKALIQSGTVFIGYPAGTTRNVFMGQDAGEQ